MFVTYLLGAVAVTIGAWRDPTSGWAGSCCDQEQAIWYLGWTPHALAHGLNPFFTTQIGAPVGREFDVEPVDAPAGDSRLAPGKARRTDLRIQRPCGAWHSAQRVHGMAGDPPLGRRRARSVRRWRGLRLLALRHLPCGPASEPGHGLDPATASPRDRRPARDAPSTAVAIGGGPRSPRRRSTADQRGTARHQRHRCRCLGRRSRGCLPRRAGPAG